MSSAKVTRRARVGVLYCRGLAGLSVALLGLDIVGHGPWYDCAGTGAAAVIFAWSAGRWRRVAMLNRQRRQAEYQSFVAAASQPVRYCGACTVFERRELGRFARGLRLAFNPPRPATAAELAAHLERHRAEYARTGDLGELARMLRLVA